MFLMLPQLKIMFPFIFAINLLQEWTGLEMIQAKNKRIHEECISLKLRVEALKKFAMDNKIPLPPEFE